MSTAAPLAFVLIVVAQAAPDFSWHLLEVHKKDQQPTYDVADGGSSRKFLASDASDSGSKFLTDQQNMLIQDLNVQQLKEKVLANTAFQQKVQFVCDHSPQISSCEGKATEALFCQLLQRSKPKAAVHYCHHTIPPASLLQKEERKAPEDELAKEMTHDLQMNFNKIAPFGKEDTAKELQDHAAKTQDTLVDAVENAEVAEIKRAVFRALTRLRAATIKEFDTIARLETQAIDAYNDAHHYRAENPLAHLHEDEAPVETDKLKSFH